MMREIVGVARFFRYRRTNVRLTNAMQLTNRKPRINGWKPSRMGFPRCSSRIALFSTVPVTFIEPDGTERTVDAELGKNLLDVAHNQGIDLEGACGGELACSTCHLIFPEDIFQTLPKMTEDEEDMLDMAFELTETSRLGCQIEVRDDFSGFKVKIPDDGF